MPKSHYWETLLPPAPHQACKSRAVRWQRLDAGRWRDSEAERPRAGAAGRGKACQERVSNHVRIRPYGGDVEVVKVRHVTAYRHCERRTAYRRSGHSWRNAAGRRTTRATTQVHWVDVATCPRQSPIERCQGVHWCRLWRVANLHRVINRRTKCRSSCKVRPLTDHSAMHSRMFPSCDLRWKQRTRFCWAQSAPA